MTEDYEGRDLCLAIWQHSLSVIYTVQIDIVDHCNCKWPGGFLAIVHQITMQTARPVHNCIYKYNNTTRAIHL